MGVVKQSVEDDDKRVTDDLLEVAGDSQAAARQQLGPKSWHFSELVWKG